jgi:hypothetical protein
MVVDINRTADLMATLVEKRTSHSTNGVMLTLATMSSTPPCIPKTRSLVECLDDVCRIYEHEKQIMDNTGMSPIQDT